MQNDSTLKITNSKNQVLGVVDGRILRIVKSTSHIVRKFNGVGANLDTLQKAQELGADILEFTFFENKDVYTCLIDEYISWAHRDDLGAGTQLFLAFKSFKYSVLNRKPTQYSGAWTVNKPIQTEMFK
jgi:hypothetical protein